MNYLQKFVAQFRNRLFLILLLNNFLIIIDWYLATKIFELTGYWLLVAILVVPVVSVLFIPWLSAVYLTQPTKLLWQAILHIAPDTTGVPPPNIKQLRFGREMVSSLIAQIYQIANVADNIEKTANAQPMDLKSDLIANNLPLPLLVLDKDNVVIFANELFCLYIGTPAQDIVGKDVYSVVDLSFNSNDTFDTWLKESQNNTMIASHSWDHVKLNRVDQPVLQFDLAAHYNKGNPNKVETILAFFDRTKLYEKDDQATGFVSLAVHELRTPLTLMRGYIEVLDEELEGKMDDETAQYLQKMKVAAQTLTTFVNNILNVARIEGDQLELQMHEENWADIVTAAEEGLRLRSQVRGIEIEFHIPDNLPKVGVDRSSITEVLDNLVNNAIKYSGNGKKIIVSSQLTNAGEIETTIKDFGIGIPENVVPNLFNKYYRSHRSRAEVSGTGLGLYLSKVIVSAHGGNIWVRSAEGEGSTFGFTVLPYTQLADEQKNSANKDITRSAHGWIKNHSMYRR
ncbi:MAG TPA: HAMP domain-containing sensor histidine kinase [Candidatus Saccharimonadales bacterium]|nr:HAMP domain-containing sensor histidine kinase [Candidatus Saccharimonadales bacterium]